MTTRLIHYNSNLAVHEKNHDLAGVAKFSKFFKIYNPSVLIIDRTGTLRTPFRVKSLFPIPEFRPMKRSFEEICDERARELLSRADTLGVTLYVFYSGGIDSTLLLISLLKNAEPSQKENLVVLMSEESILENPNFYREHIHGKLHIDSISKFPQLLGSRHMFVGGEHNDQLFGSDKMAKLILKFGPSIIQQPYKRETFFALFNESLNDASITNFYLDLFERLKDAAPVPIETNQDYLWWINFSLKWQSVFMRMLSRVTPRNASNIDAAYITTNYNHFYNTDDFQLWSMNNMDKKIRDRWETYKWPCKEIIYDYTKDADYRDNKTKKGSLYHVFLQQDTYNFIDESMGFHHEIDLQEYHNPNNDFA